ncbi:SLC13 family permease [Fulvivirga lutea]|uniref:SLC13 family permease n=1 Tax=Fulvivirga lutea TaxID=2810512 RepID=A0A974WDF3_9BACT|nr:SLC13 family permease [Fulvivirga lutea]QSE95983.1 SLC13 family permease [Fulvivirga lutea]
MTYDIIITILVISLTIFLFVKEYFSIDLVALSAIVILVSTGVITVEDGLNGFSNEATLTVMAMFILSHALVKTKVIEYLAPMVVGLLKKGYIASVSSLAFFIGGTSAFVNNTPIVATFIPVVTNASRKISESPSRYLMVLSYVSIFGGCCTLIGTSTNLLVSGMAVQEGHEAFTLFQMAPLGIILLVAGSIYLILVGKKILPDRISRDYLHEQEGAKAFLAEVKMTAKSEEEKKSVESLFNSDGIEVRALKQAGGSKSKVKPDHQIASDDVFIIEGDFKKIHQLVKNDFLKISDSFEDSEFPDEQTRLMEIVLLPNSELIGKRLSKVNFLKRYNSSIIAIRHRGKRKFEDLKNIKLKSGDVLVLLTNDKGHELIQADQEFENAPFISLREQIVEKINKGKLLLVSAVIASVIILASFGILPIVIAALGGVVVLNLLGVITMTDAYRSIDWKVIFMLAGSLCLGKAMISSGLADLLGDGLITLLSVYSGPVIMVSMFYLLTSLLTETMSNHASAALMVPIAISVASTLDVSPTPLLLTIAFAGSASFMTPIGYQTNTMIYSAGNYKFSDFIRVGGGLNLLFWILSSLLIPLIYSF